MLYGNENDNVIAVQYLFSGVAHSDPVNYCSVNYNLK